MHRVSAVDGDEFHVFTYVNVLTEIKINKMSKEIT